jgi:hypothetical protein
MSVRHSVLVSRLEWQYPYIFAWLSNPLRLPGAWAGHLSAMVSTQCQRCCALILANPVTSTPLPVPARVQTGALERSCPHSWRTGEARPGQVTVRVSRKVVPGSPTNTENTRGRLFAELQLSHMGNESVSAAFVGSTVSWRRLMKLLSFIHCKLHCQLQWSPTGSQWELNW